MWSFKRFTKLHIALFALLTIIFVGVIGYSNFEGYNILDSLYMTVITLSTVGYREINPLSDNGKIFTIFLIITSFGIFAYAISAISSYIFTGEFRRYFKLRKVERTLGDMKDHVIICGYGRNGRRAAESFIIHHVDFVVIEKNEKVVNDMEDNEGILFVYGDSTEDAVLERAGINSARAIISTLPVDADNLFTVLTARGLNDNLLIISRASQDNSYSKLKMAGANNVIMPDKIGGAHMAALVLKPDVVEFFDQIIMNDTKSSYLKEVVCSDLSEDDGKHTLSELKRICKSGVTIIGMKNSDGSYVVNPSNDLTLMPHSKLFVLGTPEQIDAL